LQDEESNLTERFVILTRDANLTASDIYNRMPVILHKGEIVRWLRDYKYAKSIMIRDSISLIREAV